MSISSSESMGTARFHWVFESAVATLKMLGIEYQRSQPPRHRHGRFLEDRPLFLIQTIANPFCQGVDGEGLLKVRHFGAQYTVANHHIVCIAALKEYL